MQKITLEDGQSANIIDENIAGLKALFPDAFTSSGVNFDVLRQLLGDASVLEEGEEKYGLNWHGKKMARQIALTPSVGTLLPCPEESVDWENSQNLFIEGDNLEVLKLLQKSYARQIKLIYIDPPYNTGKEFVYPDKFQDNLQTYLKYTGQVDSEGVKFSSNTETGGRKHTNWLNMMLPRLRVAKNLLKSDGAIFVSCDENEHTRLRALMDEVFGEENFVADMVWAAGRKNDSKLVSISHEYIVCYAREIGYLKENNILWRQRKKGLDEIYAQYEKLKAKFGNNYEGMTEGLRAWFKSLPDGAPAKAHKHYKCIDKRGIYFPADISWPGGGGPKYEVLHPVTKKPVKVPQRGWMTANEANMQAWIDDDRVHFGKDENSVPCIKAYLADQEFQAPYSVFYQDGRAATKLFAS
jgi:adenine-specific DNA-methyltransferase